MSSAVTVIELQEKCRLILAKREIVDSLEAKFKEADKELRKDEEDLISTMTELELKSFKESGMLFGVRETMQLATPKGLDKEKFFEYLKSVGHFDALATVHARTLVSWYNQENEAALARGEPYAAIPGLELPTKRLGLSIRKSN